MAERAADDFPAINARLKEIEAELAKGIMGTPETPAPTGAETVYGGTGGFITPDGGYYGGC